MDKFDINLNLYRSFYSVAKYEGFTNASKYEHISQSTFSSNIKKLEDLLNVKLIRRNSNTFQLTEEGEKLYLKLNKIIEVLNDDIEKSELRIGCLRFIADNYLYESIQKFNKKYKDIRLNFRIMNSNDMIQLLKKEELDLVISRYPVFYKYNNEIVIEKIIDTENVFACSNKFYNLNKNKLLKKNYTFPMILPDSSEKRRIIEQYLLDNNINYKVLIEIPNSLLLKKFLINNMGIVYINKKIIESELNNGDVVILDNFKNMPIDNISIMYKNNKKSNVLFELIKIITSTIKKDNK